MSWARLAISDGTTTIDLLSRRVGYHLKSWKPARATYKEGGIYHSNPWADGRRLILRRFDNVVETIVLQANDDDADSLIARQNELSRMLQAASDYWEDDYNTTPVYLIARAQCETNTRYAVIVQGGIPEENDPYQPPFSGDSGAAMSELSLIIERRHWQSTIPGNADCVQVSALQTTDGSATVITGFSPTQSADDAYVLRGTAIDTGGIDLRVGGDPGFEDLGIRFRAVTIPAGATITKAYFTVTSSAAFGSASPIYTRIYGERNSAPAVFSTLADFAARTLTTNTTDWNLTTTLITTPCNSPDISSIIQEIIGSGGWASGNNLVIFMRGMAGSATQDAHFHSFDSAANLPTLTVEYITTTPDELGRGATCEDEVYVTNKHMRTQITHAYWYDAVPGAWSGNLIGTALPYSLLPAVPAANDILYVGSTTAISSSGPFSSLVFDNLVSFGSVGTWQYYDSGTGWTTLPISYDATDRFYNTGVGSVSWLPPATWTTVAVNGVTGWWVRFLCAGAAAAPPRQQNRDIYTVNTPFVTVASAQIGGDIPALAQFRMTCKHDYKSGLLGGIQEAQRVIVGTRKTSRGADFTPCINISDIQNPTGVAIFAGYKTAFASDNSVPTRRKMTFTATGVEAMAMRANIGLMFSICEQYYGRFRAIGVVKAATGAYSLWTLSLSLNVVSPYATATVFTTEERTLNNTTAMQLVDFGTLDMPPVSSRPVTPYENSIYINVESTGAGTLDLIELWLMPVDEWSGEFIETAERDTALGWEMALVVDSAVIPKKQMQAYTMKEYMTTVWEWLAVLDWQCVAGYPFTLKPNEEQRLWFLCAYAPTTDTNAWRYEPNMLHVVQLFKVQRYLSMRGAA